MRKKFCFISTVTLAFFLLNTIIPSNAFSFPVGSNDIQQNLATPSILDDLTGIQHKDIGRISITLQAQLKALSEQSRGQGSLLDFMHTSITNKLKKEATIYQPAEIQLFLREADSVGENISVMCRIKDTEGTRTYYAVFASTTDKDNGFPVKGIYTEEEYERYIKDAPELLRRKIEDEKAIERYISHETGVDAIIRYAYNRHLAKDLQGGLSDDLEEMLNDFAADLKIDVKPGPDLSQIAQRKVSIIKKNAQIQKLLESNPVRIVDADGNEHQVVPRAHSSNNAIYIFVEAQEYEDFMADNRLSNVDQFFRKAFLQRSIVLRRMASATGQFKVPAGDDPDEDTSAIDRIFANQNEAPPRQNDLPTQMLRSLFHEVGVICGLPVIRVDEDGRVYNEIDERVDKWFNGESKRDWEEVTYDLVDLDKNLPDRDYADGDELTNESSVEVDGAKWLRHRVDNPKRKVLIVEPIDERAVDILRKEGDVDFDILLPESEPLSQDQLLAMLRANPDYTTLLVFVKYEFNAEVFDLLPDLTEIVHFSTGFNNTDIEEATKRGIKVTNAPGPLTRAMAELNMGLLLDAFYGLTDNIEAVEKSYPAGQLTLEKIMRGEKPMSEVQRQMYSQILWGQLLRTSLRLDDMYKLVDEGKFVGCGVGKDRTVLHNQLATDDEIGNRTKVGVIVDGSLRGREFTEQLAEYAKSFGIESGLAYYYGKGESLLYTRFHSFKDAEAAEKEQGLVRYLELEEMLAECDYVIRIPGSEGLGEEELALAEEHGTEIVDPAKLVIKEKDWRDMKLRSLSGMTFSIAGMGRIGTMVAERAMAFGMRVLGHDVRISPQAGALIGRENFVDKDTLVREADVITTLMNLTPDTTGWLSARELAMLKKDAFILNTSRGAALNEPELIEFLKQRTDVTVRVDVLAEEEREDTDKGLAELPNVKCTGHTGSAVEPVRYEMARAAIEDNFIPMKNGEEPAALKNPEVLEVIAEQNKVTGGDKEISEMLILADEAGKEIPTHPDTRYTLFMTSEFFANGEFEEHRSMYADRFDLATVSVKPGDRESKRFVDKILAQASAIENRAIALVSDKLPEEQLKRLTDAGIRFIRANTDILLDARRDKKEERSKFQQDTYAMMLLARCVDENIPRESSIYRLLAFYIRSHFELDEVTAEAYIDAIVRNDIATLIKGLLSYMPITPYDAQEDYDKISQVLTAA